MAVQLAPRRWLASVITGARCWRGGAVARCAAGQGGGAVVGVGRWIAGHQGDGVVAGTKAVALAMAVARWIAGHQGGGAVAAQLTPGRIGRHQGKPLAPYPAKVGAFRGAVWACAAVGSGGTTTTAAGQHQGKGAAPASQAVRAGPVFGPLARRRRKAKNKRKGRFYMSE